MVIEGVMFADDVGNNEPVGDLRVTEGVTAVDHVGATEPAGRRGNEKVSLSNLSKCLRQAKVSHFVNLSKHPCLRCTSLVADQDSDSVMQPTVSDGVMSISEPGTREP
jgi:hypothetical protein